MTFAGVWPITATECLPYHFNTHLNQLSHPEDGGSTFVRNGRTQPSNLQKP